MADNTQVCAIITGAAGGLGQALCAEFHDAGYYVIATDRRDIPVACDVFIKEDIRSICDESLDLYKSTTAEPIPAGMGKGEGSPADAATQQNPHSDMQYRARGNSFARQLVEAMDGRPLKALVNNAATQILGATEAVTHVAWEESLQTNLYAPFRMVQAFLPELRDAGGSVVNVASIHAVATKPGFVCYATSKAALAGLTRALAVDLAPEVRVNAINLAATDTPMLREGFAGNPQGLAELASMHPLNRIATPREAAQVCVFLASDKASFITGASWHIDGGIGCRLHDPA